MSYKLEFETTNNTTKYEALILGLKVAKDLGVVQIAKFGDSELIIHQVKNAYQVRQIKLRTYRNEVWSIIENYFTEFNITFISKGSNQLADSLVVAASTFRVPEETKIAYEI